MKKDEEIMGLMTLSSGAGTAGAVLKY
ncbi:hypothetical protein B14911_21183 [Bacillus sp. NRRL B-14911]|nr:hypothetical protein B14911_21183 [Bacillus sp. NRRL B-14911]